MRPREIERLLLEDGWSHKTTKGSHKHFVHPTKPGKVTVPQHPGDSIDKRTWESIKRQAGLN